MKDNPKKQIITMVAQNIFSKHGLLKTTVDEIAKAARMGKASLYHYFQSKEEIFKEVVEQENRFLKEKIRDAVNREKNPQKKMKIYILKKMEYLKELANIHSALKDDYLKNYAFIEKIREKNSREELFTIREILQDGEDKGIFEIDDIELTSFAITSALKGLEYPWSINISFPEIESNINKLLEILFHGIEKK
ncbi:MAG: TetR/AcrR family transcriptional regulator [Candidatus Cloacimonadota bacterium]|nr:MAG: TetR/AcrR family transcriptional regulator [Candidatus Cloacimonadota bacterium]